MNALFARSFVKGRGYSDANICGVGKLDRNLYMRGVLLAAQSISRRGATLERTPAVAIPRILLSRELKRCTACESCIYARRYLNGGVHVVVCYGSALKFTLSGTRRCTKNVQGLAVHASFFAGRSYSR